MSRRVWIVLAAIGVAFAGVATADQGRRMTDKEVKKLMETVEKDVERFNKAVDSQYRKATLRTATGEVDIGAYLKNLKEHAKRMKDRFDSKYAAAPEVLTFLRHAQPVEARRSRGETLFGAETEWPRLSGDVARLSAEYGVRWGTDPAAWNPRRVNDDELERVLKSLQKDVGTFRKGLDGAAKKADVAKAERQKALDTAKRMEEAVKDLQKAAGKGADASGALALLASSVDQTRSFVTTKGLESAVATSWAPIETGWNTVRSAFP